MTNTLSKYSQLPKRLLKTKEAATFLGMAKDKLLALSNKGEIPFIQETEKSPRRFDVKDLVAYIRKQKSQ